MKSLIQEKYEITFPEPGDDDGHQWVPLKDVLHGNSPPAVFNELPPGSDIDNQHLADIRRPPRTMSGETDVSRDWNREAVRDGYKRLPMRPTEDQYSDEHRDTFYLEETVDGDTGFAERGNVLDRQ